MEVFRVLGLQTGITLRMPRRIAAVAVLLYAGYSTPRTDFPAKHFRV